MNIKQHKISFIVPVYNAEKHVGACLSSILSQTYSNFEVIAINDGSKDDSISVLKKYANQDRRIKIINKLRNEGVSAARNSGIEIATGDYILFVDADDTISPDYTESYFNHDLSEYNCLSLVIQGCTWYYKGIERKYICPKGCFEKKDFSYVLSNYEIFRHGSPYGKLYSNIIIKEHNIRFCSEVRNYEDLLFFLDYLEYTNEMVFIESTGYQYYASDDGLNSKDSGLEGEKLLLNLYIDKTKKYWDIPESKMYSYTKFLLIRVLYTMKKYLDSNDFQAEARKLLLKYSFIFESSNNGIRKKDVIFLFFAQKNLFGLAFATHFLINKIKRTRNVIH